MARFAIVCAFLAALLVAAQATDFSGARRHLMQMGARASSGAMSTSNSSTGSANAAADIRVTDGVGMATALATAEINEKSAIEVERIWVGIKETVSEDADCDDVRLTADVEVNKSVAAIAEVYASAFGSVTIDGSGAGCADAFATADATAVAYVEVIIDVALSLAFEGDEEKANAFAGAYADLVNSAVATAWAEAFASGCSTVDGGESFVLAEQNSFARAVATPIIVAYAWAEVGQNCGELAYSESRLKAFIDTLEMNVAEADSFTIVEGEGTATAEGDAATTTMEVGAGDVAVVDAKIEGVGKCSGSQGVCCRIDADADVCHCTLSSRESARRCAATKEVGSTKTLWTEPNGDAKTGAFTCWCD